MPKSPDAFRTISEVADWLGVQAHVLRFWESKFTQVKPIKRAGGRRYYRPADMLLLGGLRQLLHEDGLTIKGAQKLLREKGVAHVADLSQPLDDLTIAVIEGNAEEADTTIESSSVAELESLEADASSDDTPAVPEPSTLDSLEPKIETADDAEMNGAPDDALSSTAEIAEGAPDQSAIEQEQIANEAAPKKDLPEPIEEPDPLAQLPDPVAEVSDTVPEMDASPETDEKSAEEPADVAAEMPSFRAHARRAPEADAEAAHSDETEAEEPPEETDIAPEAETFSVAPPTAKPDAPPKPRVIDVGPLPELTDFPAEPGALSAVTSVSLISSEQADAIRPLLARLTRLRASMASPRKDIRKD